jgi:hypothetical protein
VRCRAAFSLHIHGHHRNTPRRYASGRLCVVMSHQTRSQKIFNCHSRAVTSISLHPSATVCASAQGGPNGRVIIWRVTDCSVLAVLSADLNDGVISVAFSSSGCSLACICADPSHTIHVYALPAISAASFDEENFSQDFGGRVNRVWQWKSKALDVTGIYFDTGPRELPITFGRKHLRFWNISKKAREHSGNYQGDLYLLVGDDMGNGFQCCLVMQMPEVRACSSSSSSSSSPMHTPQLQLTRHHSRVCLQITLTGMDNGDIYIWGNTQKKDDSASSQRSHLLDGAAGGGPEPAAAGAGREQARGRRRLSKISSAHKGGVTSLCRCSQGSPSRIDTTYPL